MRVPREWLEEFVAIGIPTAELAERLAMTGTEVDRVLRHGPGSADAFVVGRVLTAEAHPNADRLRVCKVDVGEGDPATIVCGAPNVAAGQTVAVARPGALMPGGVRLGQAKLRGVASEGMILAEDEIGLGTDHAGIIVLADGLTAGSPLAEVLPLGTDVLELEVTPNRPDCLGLHGVAREVHAATGGALGEPPSAVDPGSPGGEVPGVEIVVSVPELCPRFTARLYEGVEVGPSPPWLRARLMAAGQRPISNVVDITNYAMLVTGQPLHAFDWDRVAGGRLEIRRAGEGEEVRTLDGQTRRLDPDVVLIADAEGPTSIAGVMGGERSEVQADTTRVLMEVATWDGPNINRTSARLGLRSEASGRNEKGLQPEQTFEAQAVAARLMEAVCGVTPTGGTVDAGGPGPAALTLRLRRGRLAGLLGREIPAPAVERILGALGFGVAEAEDGWDVTVPHWRRADVTREADLVEEVVRLDGVEKLPATLPPRRGVRGRLSPRQVLRRRAADALTGRGLSEVVGWSFTAPDLVDRLELPEGDPRRHVVRIRNPMSEEESVLRTTLLGSLLENAARSLDRGAGAVRLFQLGTVFFATPEGHLPRERQHLAGLLAGPVRPPSWRESAPGAADFFAAKGVVEGLLATLRVRADFAAAEEPFLHPGRAARMGELGWLGEVHPLVLERWELPPLVAFELDLDAVEPVGAPQFRALPELPAVHQDLAIVVDEGVSAAAVLAAARGAADTLEAVEVFDVYAGAQVGEGRVSLALHLTFRAPDRTLTEAEASAERERILARLRDAVGADARA